jgi:CRP-like cAMP-binding protein
LDKKIEYFAIKSVTGKICAYLYDQYKLNGGPLFDIPFDRNELADFLNVSRPTLSRELAKLKEQGIIDYYLNSFKVLDIEKLEQELII